MAAGTTTDKVSLRVIDGPDYRRDEEGWEHNSYTVELQYQGRTMRTPWKQGLEITDDPDATSVLESLFLDASGYDNAADFEDWAGQYGYDEDSRKAEALYHEVGKQAGKLARLFGYSDSDHPRWMSEAAEELARELSA